MKNFTDFFIQRPVFALVVNLFIILIGLIAYNSLTIRQYPRLDASTVTIVTTYAGANARTMEGYVTTPIENAISGVDGLDYITSRNIPGSSTISAFFQLGYPIEQAVNDIVNKVNEVRGELPNEIDPPIISKEDPSSQPTMFISFRSKTQTPEQLTDFLLRVVQPQIQTLPGVGQVNIFGGQKYAMRIWLDPHKMAAFSVTAQDIRNALEHGNLQSAAGRVQSKLQELNIVVVSDIGNPEEFNNLVISSKDNHFIRIKDVGRAELGSEEMRSSVVINDLPAVVIGIIPKSTANPLDVSREVHKTFALISKDLPRGITAAINWDTSRFIQESLKGVRNSIIEAVAFVVLVIFLFLGSFRAMLIPVVTIPLSLIGACILMYTLNYTINTLTLLAFVLAIGLVVDDAIVVLENIHRHIEEGIAPREAALQGAREIGFAIIAMTFTLAAVYAPLGFTGGLTGSLFREFAFTLAGSVVISGIVALTLSPMMCSRVLTQHEPTIATKINKIAHTTQEHYKKYLEKVMTRKASIAILMLALSVYVGGYALQKFLNEELAPDEDQGAILTIVSAPVSASLHYVEQYTNQLLKIYKTIPEAAGYGAINGFNGVSSSFSFLVLTDWEARQRSVNQIIGELFGKYAALTGVNAFPINLPSLPSTGFFPVEFVIKTMGSYEDLNQAMNKVLVRLRNDPRLVNVDVDLKYSQPQLNVLIERNKAADLGINVSDLSATLNMALGEPIVTRFIKEGRGYSVIPQVMEEFRNLPNKLNNFTVRTQTGELVPLSSFIKLEEIIAPDSYNHFQQMRSVTVTASVIPGYSLGEALSNIMDAAKQELPDTFQYDYAGMSRQFIESQGMLQFALFFALLFIFLVLSAQFESFVRPLIVMTSVPLSLAGALLTLFLVGGTLNIYTKIGLVTLVGLISKHGILLVDFSHRLQSSGLAVKEAVIQAASLRLRPILMTTAAMVLGALPLALGSGAGGEARRQIGWVIVGGMSFGTLLTLFVVPAAYFLIYSRKKTNA